MLIVGIFLFPFLVGQDTNTTTFIFQESFNKAYGGSGCNGGIDFVQTMDGGFALVGGTTSYGAGETDMWLVKTNANGEMIWNQTYGDKGWDGAFSLVQTVDGDFALLGETTSYGAGETDMWLVKTDTNGEMIWHQTYGGTEDERGHSLVQTTDGGFALLGYTNSYGTGSGRSGNIWLVKTDANGEMIWHQTYNGIGDEGGYGFLQTIDRGFVFVGEHSEFGAGTDDLWLVKTDANGAMIWYQTYGSTGDDQANAVIQTVDGGFAVAGETRSYGAGNFDMWLVRTDANGMLIWQQTYGGAGMDGANDLVQMADGGFVLLGTTDSFGEGESVMWLVRTDANGKMIWHQTYGIGGWDGAYSLIQTADGEFAMLRSPTSFLVEGSWGERNSTIWLVKTNVSEMVQPSSTSTTPVSTTISSSNLTLGWEPLSLLVAVVVLTTWYKRHKKTGMRVTHEQ
jgi:hypothetical protein